MDLLTWRRNVAQNLVRIEILIESNAGIFAVHPDNPSTSAQLIAPEHDRRPFDRKLRAFDERTFRREIAKLDGKARTGVLQLCGKQYLRAAGATVLTRCAAVHPKSDK